MASNREPTRRQAGFAYSLGAAGLQNPDQETQGRLSSAIFTFDDYSGASPLVGDLSFRLYGAQVPDSGPVAALLAAGIGILTLLRTRRRTR